MKTIIGDFFNFLFPRPCPICNQTLEKEEYFCKDCAPENKQELWLTNILQKVNSKWKNQIVNCYQCQELTTNYFSGLGICPICQFFPLKARSIRSIWYYQDEVEDLIKQYKYHSQTHLANYFAEQLYQKILDKHLLPSPFPEIIVPLPSSLDLLAKREFHHTHLIAQKLAKHLLLPYSAFYLRPRKKRLPQAKLKLNKRSMNMKNAFLTKPHELKSKRVLLFDDVITSGASINSAITELFNAGCATIDVLTLARSKNFSKNRIKLSTSSTEGRTSKY